MSGNLRHQKLTKFQVGRGTTANPVHDHCSCCLVGPITPHDSACLPNLAQGFILRTTPGRTTLDKPSIYEFENFQGKLARDQIP